MSEAQRIADLEARILELSEAVDTSWVLSSAALVILMQLGFAMLEAGTVRSNNVVTTYSKNILDFVVGTLVALCFGYRISYDVDPLVINLDGSERGAALPDRFLFHLAFQATAATILSGAMAERVRIGAYALLAALMAIVYCVNVRLTWGGGWLQQIGFHDFAGTGIVHLSGGAASLAGCSVIGARMGRWDAAFRADFVPHNIPSVLGGTLLLFVGWFGFNPGSSLGMSSTQHRLDASAAAMTTAVSSSAAAAVVVISSLIRSRGKTINVLAVANGLLAGLVAITGGCDVIDPGLSAVVGAVSAAIYYGASFLSQRLGVDDVVDAFAVHGASGLWGCVAVGLFHRTSGLFTHGKWDQLGVQSLGGVILAGLSSFFVSAACLLLKRFGMLRVSLEQEALGLDSEFGLSAYVAKSEVLQRCGGTAILLRSMGYEPHHVLDALRSLRSIIYRPFTPQAADNKLEGEVADILALLDDGATAVSSSLGPLQTEHLAFVSHHKEDAGDAARIFVDTAKRLVAGPLFEHLDATGVRQRISPENMFFLDSTNLQQLGKLLEYVAVSSNHVLLLSRSVLERPWVLAELCEAHKLQKNITLVLVEFARRHQDPKAFRFPDALEAAISDWKEYEASELEASGRPRRSARTSRVLIRREAKQSKYSGARFIRTPTWRSKLDVLRRSSGAAANQPVYE